jgi:hypothetical protein
VPESEGVERAQRGALSEAVDPVLKSVLAHGPAVPRREHREASST